MRLGYLSFRIAGTDGVSLEAERWKVILTRMGHSITFIAGELDQPGLLVPQLHFTHPEIYKIHELVVNNNINYRKVEREIFALSGEIEGELRSSFRNIALDGLIVSNVFSLPIHFPLAVALERVISEFKIPTVSRNHDFWWERERYLKSHCFEFFKRFFPPNHPFIKHVTINSIAQQELKERMGIESQVIGDSFDYANPKLARVDNYSNNFRSDFKISPNDFVFLQATRIVPRKNIEASIELVRRLNDPRIILVLAGYAGDESGDYSSKLKRLAKKAKIRTKFIGSRIKCEREVIDGMRFYTLWDCFINCDFSTYPSTMEGFGNQYLEAVYFKKPVFINRYRVYLADLEPLGFENVAISDGKVTNESVNQVRNLLQDSRKIKSIVEKNFKIATANFSFEATEKKLIKLGLAKKKLDIPTLPIQNYI